MPVYNAARYLGEAIDSVLAQTFRDFELIAVDDGSTDGSGEILGRYARQDARVRVVSQPNRGVGAATNEAISHCRGEFIARMDSDDVCLPRRLEAQVGFLRGHPDHVAVGSMALLIDAEGAPLFEMAGLYLTHEEIDRGLLAVEWSILQPTVTMRTAAVRAVGGYRNDLRIHEDHDLFLKLAEIGRLANLPDVLLKYRQRSDSTVTACADLHVPSLESVLKEAWRRRGLIGVREIPPVLPHTNDPQALLKRHREWGWRSLNAGNVRTARKYARAGLRLAPFSRDSWMLMYHALRAPGAIVSALL